MSPLLTTEQVAELLSVDAKTVRTLTDDGALRVVRIGKPLSQRQVSLCLQAFPAFRVFGFGTMSGDG